MAVNDRIWTSLPQHGGGTINERVYNYLGSLGFTGTISDRLAKYTHNNKHGWQAIIEGFGLSLSAGVIRHEVFGGSEQGAMYIPQPTYLGQQTLYQDSAGSIPVTSDSDPVGLMIDLSGNSHNAKQSSDSNRPIYRTDGNTHWLATNGIDQYMTVDSRLGFSTNPALSIVLSISETGTTSDGRIVAIGSGTGSLEVGHGTAGWAWRHNNGAKIFDVTPNGVRFTVSFIHPAGGDYASSSMFRDGVDISATSTSSGTTVPTNTADIAQLFRRPGTDDLPAFVNFFGGIVSGATSPSIREKSESYLDSLSI